MSNKVVDWLEGAGKTQAIVAESTAVYKEGFVGFGAFLRGLEILVKNQGKRWNNVR